MAQILVVDDNIDVCKPLTRLLKHFGHEADYVTSGECAVKTINAEKHPDLVILDVMMPGMDGMEVLRAIRSQQNLSDVRIVMYSAVADPEYKTHALNKGANDYWTKASVSFEEIRKRLDELLSKPPQHLN